MKRICVLLGASLAVGVAGLAGADESAGFGQPVRLDTASAQVGIDTAFEGLRGSGIGYAGPHAVDFDGDGVTDLLIGDIFGYVFFFQGQAGGAFADAVPVRMADGEALQFSNW